MDGLAGDPTAAVTNRSTSAYIHTYNTHAHIYNIPCIAHFSAAFHLQTLCH